MAENVLKQEMLDSQEVDEKKLKENDLVKLKNNQFAKIVSDGEYINDIDYGEMYANIKRFELISLEEYNFLTLQKENYVLKKEVEKLTKENNFIKLKLYLALRKQEVGYHDPYSPSLNIGNSGQLYKEFRESKNICSVDGIGTFYLHNNAIMLLEITGYVSSYYKVNISENELIEAINKYQ